MRLKLFETTGIRNGNGKAKKAFSFPSFATHGHVDQQIIEELEKML
ncbi:hypothetical protein [Aequorivita capsosiphonis]|nr:hypothetical protein [Aequorivita capsosiphonis]